MPWGRNSAYRIGRLSFSYPKLRLLGDILGTPFNVYKFFERFNLTLLIILVFLFCLKKKLQGEANGAAEPAHKN
jgi:hypothetical protein